MGGLLSLLCDGEVKGECLSIGADYVAREGGKVMEEVVRREGREAAAKPKGEGDRFEGWEGKDEGPKAGRGEDGGGLERHLEEVLKSATSADTEDSPPPPPPPTVGLGRPSSNAERTLRALLRHYLPGLPRSSKNLSPLPPASSFYAVLALTLGLESSPWDVLLTPAYLSAVLPVADTGLLKAALADFAARQDR
jgi:hypothetical protein